MKILVYLDWETDLLFFGFVNWIEILKVFIMVIIKGLIM